MDPLPRLDGHIEMTRRIRDPGEEREIGSCERSLPIGVHEEVVCLLPGAAGDGLARPIERGRFRALLHRPAIL